MKPYCCIHCTTDRGGAQRAANRGGLYRPASWSAGNPPRREAIRTRSLVQPEGWPRARSDRTHAKIMSAATQVGQSATTSSLKSSSADADDVRLGSVNTEQNVATWSTRRATLPAEGDTWQPGDGYHGQANLEAKLDAAFADGSEASHVPASCSSRRGNECLGGSRASLVAANAPLVGKYSPPALSAP